MQVSVAVGPILYPVCACLSFAPDTFLLHHGGMAPAKLPSACIVPGTAGDSLVCLTIGLGGANNQHLPLMSIEHKSLSSC